MNKTPRLGRSGIEYLDYVWNFYSGCNHKKMGICSVDKCWAEAITKRMSHNYPNGFEPTFYPEAFTSPLHLKPPSIIGCAFMGDLFGDWVDPEQKFHAAMPSGKASITMSLKGWIFTTIRQCHQHRFLFLTKRPQNLSKWGNFPDNCWVGVSATGNEAYHKAIDILSEIDAKVKYLSLEPLLGRIEVDAYLMNATDWIIIGGQTKPTVIPKIEWVKEIVEAADGYGIPVFIKNNLAAYARNLSLYPKMRVGDDGWDAVRQEMPTTNV